MESPDKGLLTLWNQMKKLNRSGTKRSVRVEIPVLLKYRLDGILEHGDLSQFVKHQLRQLVLLTDRIGVKRARELIRTNQLRLTTHNRETEVSDGKNAS